MAHEFTSDVGFTPAVKAIQEQKGSRGGYAKMEQKGGWRDKVTDDLEAYLSERNSFYLGTASADGQPYIQHRGGKKGFLKVLDDKTLAFADFKGNKQYISMGNSSENNKAYIFLMDYAARRRIKIWGELEVVEGDDELTQKVRDEDYNGVVERVMIFKITAWDVNCPQHIPVKLDQDEVLEIVEPYKARIKELENKLSNLSQ